MLLGLQSHNTKSSTQREEEAMTAENAVESSDLPVKRQRDDEENGVSVSTVSMADTDGDKRSELMSNVIPGWFSEISPMWPG